MEQRKKWQRFLIIAVVLLTIYNILPTLFYYTKPLHAPIDSDKAQGIAAEVAERVNSLEKEATQWLYSFSSLLGTSAKKIAIDPKTPQKISVEFYSAEDAKKFRAHLPRAGALIPFNPAQLTLAPQDEEIHPKKVTVLRKIPVHFTEQDKAELFAFSEKKDKEGKCTPLYREIIQDRASETLLSLGGESESSLLLGTLAISQDPLTQAEISYSLAQTILSYTDLFGEKSPVTKRYFQSFALGSSPKEGLTALESTLTSMKDSLKQNKVSLQTSQKKAEQAGSFVSEEERNQLKFIDQREAAISRALTILKKHKHSFSAKEAPFTHQSLEKLLKTSESSDLQEVAVGSKNPFIESVVIDWNNDSLKLNLHQDFIKAMGKAGSSYEKNQMEQLLINEIARISQQTGEELTPQGSYYAINLNNLTSSSSLLVLDLPKAAKAQASQLLETLKDWQPKHPDLAQENFPILSFEEYSKMDSHLKNLGLVVLAPTVDDSTRLGLRPNSIYVIAKGIHHILEKYESHPNTPEAELFLKDFASLRELLHQNGFGGYSGRINPKTKGFINDFIFEKRDHYRTLLQATRENFHVHGSKKYAVLEFTDVEQRILTENRIDTEIHEDLLKMRDDYNSAQVSLDNGQAYDVPKPTKSPLWSNLLLSAKKYFRGDDRKVLHWGLDLSGGKTVTIELLDQNSKAVSSPAALEQGINELYNRVNKMGVSEVNIHREGTKIILDFPGSQNLSAAELVKASTMFFHVVNEKFTPANKLLRDPVNKFLQEVWNEAVVTNKKDADGINKIAWKHLYGESLDPNAAEPRSDAAKTLYEQGLRLASPFNPESSANFNDQLSKIAIFRGEDYTEWHQQTHPLLVVFNNYSLQGPSLTNVRSGYDPSKGNFLSFEVKGAYTTKDGQKIFAQEDLHTWTSQFSKEKIMGTMNEEYSSGRGWRMAVILNGSIISSPNLDSSLKDRAMITGSFTQREINNLVSDLKAGSLSYTPKILSEKNVSPELGASERTRGIVATVVALLLVIATMVSYYRFAGVIASVAVLFNLIIMWAVLQNLQATLSLAGIAGIILTLGMAVDANVLVFERIREEFQQTKRLSSAIHAGYKKAFSAILDSNVTTIIAGLILLNFDSGPIKAFAITLIIGIASSMLTALFMTRYFFAGWIQNPKNKALNMMNWVKATNFNFLKHSKLAFGLSLFVILLGSLFLVTEKSSLLGMDFSGGYSMQVELQMNGEENLREKAELALLESGADYQDVQVRELSPSNHLRILLGSSMDNEGKPFFRMAHEVNHEDATYSYENNPRASWVIESLQKAGLNLESNSLKEVDNNWTAMSGQMSKSMRDNALYGLLLAFAAIFIYISVRFEYKFAASAMLCLFHDVLITLGMVGILRIFGLNIQIDMHTVAAVMTIIGYSLNDTIIVFDRIREDLKTMRKSSYTDVINHALNVTLSRTTITSATTLVVLLALVFLGGASIFSFALVMTIGVIFGTLSSLFIAPALMLFFHRQEEKKEKKIIA